MSFQPNISSDLRPGVWPLQEETTGHVSCLRCNTEIREYRQMRFTFLPYGISRAHAMLVCPNCGHVEFVAKDSPLLKDLQAIQSPRSDDD